MNEKEILKQALRNKDVKVLCKYYFKEDITLKQEILIRKVAFQEYRRLSVSATTRWGKTYCISRGIGLFILMNENKKIIFVAPQKEQSLILRDYMADLIYKCPQLAYITDFDVSGIEKIKKQASRSRQTFKNNCEYRVFTAFRGGEGLMGFGLGIEGGILVVDESALVDNDSWAKITRMLGDNPDKSTIIELCNPWDRATKAFEHWVDPAYETFHVNWEVAVEEGRTTLDFIEQQKKELTSLEFDVLYNSNFPVESEDAIFNLLRIKEAQEREQKRSGEYIISCDVADKGLDKTVIMVGYKDEDFYSVCEIIEEDVSENSAISGRIINLIKKWVGSYKINVFIDTIGVGTGVVSRVREEAEINGWLNARINPVRVIGCHYGESSIEDKDRFSNRKAEGFFRLRKIFDEGNISLLKHKILVNELLAMKWQFTSSSKIKIIDPDKSPDFADALVYFCWNEEDNNIISGRRIF
jgi:hypothetical protein